MTAAVTIERERTETELIILADGINRETENVWRAGRVALAHALEAGRLLLEAQSKVATGSWLSWMAENVKVHPTTAYRYMRLARYEKKVLDGDFQGVEEALQAISRDPWAGRRKLDAADKAQMIELAEEHGLSIEEIAKVYGCATSTVWYWTSKNNRSRHNAHHRQRTQRRLTLERAEQQRKLAAAVRIQGGFASEGYSKIRQALQAIDLARGESDDRKQSAAFSRALVSLHEAEDAVLEALGIEHGKKRR